MMSQSRTFRAAFAVCAVLWAGNAVAQEPGQGEAPPPPAVTVITLQPQDVTLTSALPGRVRAAAEAGVRPQVSGLIVERMFDEGSMVKEGDPLYKIDPRTYEAAVAQAEAALAQAKAQAESASREAERVATLGDRGVASQQTQDTAIAARDAAVAAVAAAEAQLQIAQIDLSRTTITAPIDGVIGLAQETQGALVTANQAEPLAIIRQIDPVHVDVTQSAAEIVRWQRLGPEAALPKDVDRTVKLQLADDSVYEHTGSLTAAEPQVDETTGVVVLRMEFANPDGLLLPGMYVLAEMPQAQMPDAILAPQRGVSRDRRGRPTALVVNAENVVEQRELDVVQDRGNTWIVRDGLEPGDRMIVEGLQKATPGAKVTPEELKEPEVGAVEGQAPAGGQAAPAGEAPADGAPAEPENNPAEEAPAEASQDESGN